MLEWKFKHVRKGDPELRHAKQGHGSVAVFIGGGGGLIMSPLPNFNSATVEIWHLIGNSISHIPERLIINQWWNESLNMSEKGTQSFATQSKDTAQ